MRTLWAWTSFPTMRAAPRWTTLCRTRSALAEPTVRWSSSAGASSAVQPSGRTNPKAPPVRWRGFLPLGKASFLAGCAAEAAVEHQPAKLIHKFRGQRVMPDQEAHVDGAVQRIEHQVEIEVRRQLAAHDSAAQRGVGLGPARLKKSFAKGRIQVAALLPGPPIPREKWPGRPPPD